MNSILLIVALSGLDSVEPRATSVVAFSSPEITRPRSESSFVFQQVKWPSIDPRRTAKSRLNNASAGDENSSVKSSVPSIRKSQLNEEPTDYAKQAPPTTKPLVKARETAQPEIDEEPERPAVRRGAEGGSRFGRQTQEEQPASEVRPRFGGAAERHSFDRDSDFASAPALKTSVRRQSNQDNDSAPNPYQFRPATISDDREESERRAPFRSFAIGDDEQADDLGFEPYSESSGSNRRVNVASNSGNARNSRYPDDEEDDSTKQGGGKRMPETNSNTMWGFAVVTLLLFASMGANAYLAWVAREFYERYRSLAQQVRASRNNMT